MFQTSAFLLNLVGKRDRVEDDASSHACNPAFVKELSSQVPRSVFQVFGSNKQVSCQPDFLAVHVQCKRRGIPRCLSVALLTHGLKFETDPTIFQVATSNTAPSAPRIISAPGVTRAAACRREPVILRWTPTCSSKILQLQLQLEPPLNGKRLMLVLVSFNGLTRRLFKFQLQGFHQRTSHDFKIPTLLLKSLCRCLLQAMRLSDHQVRHGR